MMMRRFEIFRIFGFPIRIDLSWLFILFLVTYSLAAGFFPANRPGLPQTAYWAMGFVAAIGLFLSILFHELSHSLVARHYKIKIDGITLFIFGGVAEMREESDSPKVEFLVAVMGPIASIILSALFFWFSRVAEAQEMNRGLVLILYYLGFMNAILAIFNLVPAFPLDGGRIFRSVLWAIKKDYFWATRIAALIGQGFGWVLVGLGIVSFFRGSAIGGIWYVLIGFFLKRASQMSLQVVKIQGELQRIAVGEVTDSNFIQFSPRDRMVDVLAMLENRTLHTQYPVLAGTQLVGFLSLVGLNALKKPGWEFREVGEFLESDIKRVSIRDTATAWEAFQKMRQGAMSLLFVVDAHGKMVGWITMERLLNRLNFSLPAASPSKKSGKGENQHP